jgi:hypothetical protein
MKLVDDLLPLNLFEEKEKFFVDQSKNPNFTYVRDFSRVELAKFGLPINSLFEHAKNILEKAFFSFSESDLFNMEGQKLTQAEVQLRTKNHLANYSLSDNISIVWSERFAARTAMGTDEIRFRLPCDFREEGFKGMLFHEIDTHALRYFNYRQQPWFKKKSQFGFSDYLSTEEGLAVLHGQIPHTNKLLYIAALRYFAVWHAQRGSFLDVWRALTPFVQSLERRWIICTRVKRGLCDTSQPGGFSKDSLYLSGPIEMYKWMQKNNYNIPPLYYGKLAWQDIDKAVALNPDYQPLIPSFYSDSPERYAEEIDIIAKANSID